MTRSGRHGTRGALRGEAVFGPATQARWSVQVKLVNATPVPARLLVVEAPGMPYRNGLVTAKATFRITKAGAQLDTQDPLPVLTRDRETPLGVLPRDELPGRDRPFEIFVLGAAYA